MTFEAAACSAKGIRELNEDSFIISSVINKIAGVYTEESISGNDEKICGRRKPNHYTRLYHTGRSGSDRRCSYYEQDENHRC